MADYLTLTTLAKNLNDDLNTVSATLYGTSAIDRAIPFGIVEDVQDYDDSKIFASDVVIPGLMIRLNSPVAPSQSYQSYSDTVTVTLYGFKRELEDLKKVLDTYIAENTGKFKRSGTWIYQAVLERPTIIDRGVDDGEDRVTVTFDIAYTFIVGGYTSDDVYLLINGERIPIASYGHSMTREATASDNLSEPGVVKFKPKKSTINKKFSMTYIPNTEITKVFTDVETGNFLTRSYTVIFRIGYTTSYDYENTETMTVSEGNIQVTEGGLLKLEFTLVKYNELS